MEPLTLALGLAQLAGAAAPLVARLVGGDKAEKAANAVVGIAKAVTGEATGEAALEVIKADPAKALEFERAVLEAEHELERAYLADRQDARARDVRLRELGDRNVRANWMIVGDVVGLCACLYVLVTQPELTGEARGLLTAIASYFGLGLRDAHFFEFGSSRGSVEKNRLFDITRK